MIVVLCLIIGLLLLFILNQFDKFNILKNKYLKLKDKPTIMKYPKYVKLVSNHNPCVYKIKNIIIMSLNTNDPPDLSLVITGENVDGGIYNATIDKFITATKKEYLKNKKDELEF